MTQEQFRITSYRNSKARHRYFPTLEAVTKVANKVFQQTNVVLGIEKVVRPQR
jgi:hypothetical protein